MSEHSDVPPNRTPRRDRAATRLLPAALVGPIGVVLGAVVLGLLGPAAPAGAAVSPAASSPAVTHAAHGHRGPVDLEAAEHVAGAARTDAAARAGVRTWRGRTLLYRETLPSKWDWSLTRAVASWNATGASIRLVPTTSRSRAQVTLGYGDTSGAAGLATVGRTVGAFVHLNRSYDRVDALDSWNRVEVMGILAHELGHVLGFEHTTTRCALMAPVLDIAGCGEFDPNAPGYYRCRTLDATLASRFVRLYGGRTRPAPAGSCLVDPVPAALGATYHLDTATDGVALSWTLPAGVPSGSRVEVRHWSAADCTDAPAYPSLDLVDPADRAWQDASGSDGQDTCFVAVLANRYGLSRPARPVLLRPTVAARLAAEQLAAEQQAAAGPSAAPTGAATDTPTDAPTDAPTDTPSASVTDAATPGDTATTPAG